MADVICSEGDIATFIAQDKGITVFLTSSNTPLVREDFFYGGNLNSNLGQAGNLSNNQSRSLSIAGLTFPTRRLRNVTVNSGTGILLTTDGGYSQSFGLGTFAPFNQEDWPDITGSNVVTVTSLGGNVNYSWRVSDFRTLWGHVVRDSKFIVRVFRSGSFTSPAPYSSSCVLRCPPDTLPCESCCLDCETIANKLKSILSKI